MKYCIGGMALCMFAGIAHAQANVNESQETATIYVDIVNGNDGNSGTQSQPLQHIAAGVALAEANNQQGIGTHIYINPGLYRENINLTGTAQDTNFPETYEAVTPGTVIITGADQYSNWTQSSFNSSVYSTPWTYNFGLCPVLTGLAPPQPDIMLRREMAIVNGASLEQVMSQSQMLEGTFYVDDAGQQLYIWPPAGTDLGSADVELADRGELWLITNKNGVVLRGLTFEYSADCVGNGAVEVPNHTTMNILMDSDNFLWNNGGGLHFTNSMDYTVTNMVANHNGAVGWQSFETVNGLIENSTADYNNWRGEEASFLDWSEGGFNPYGMVNGTFNNLNADWNFSAGVHFDTNLTNINGTNINVRNNVYHGLQLERNTGPMNLTNMISCYNANEALEYNGGGTTAAGVALRDSENVTLTNSFVYGNGNAQWNIIGEPGGINVLDWVHQQMVNVNNKNFTSTGNTFESTDASQNVVQDGILAGADWTLFINSLIAGNNTYWNAANANTFLVPVPVDDTKLNFAGWQAATQQDLTSVFAQPAGNQQDACVVNPDGPDLWAIMNSAGVTLDASGHATATYTYLPVGNFNNGPLNLSLDGVSQIPGLTATITPNSLPNGSGSAVLSATATTAIPPGAYQYTLLANAGATTRIVEQFFNVPQTSLRFSPAMTLNFGTVMVGQKSARQTLTIMNFGTKPVTSMAIGAAPQGFTYTTSCGASLAAGRSCVVNITFAPTAAVVYSPPLTITNSDPTSPQTVTLVGTGQGVATLLFSQYQLTFGPVVWNTTAMMSSVVTNTGSVPATFSSFTFSGTGASYYTLTTNTCAGGLNPGNMCTLAVSFTPETVAKTSATLVILDNVLAGQNKITMTGTGSTSVTVAPKTIGFGTHKVGTNTTKNVTFTNSGNPLAVSISLTGANANDFSYTTTCPATVPKGPCTVSVTFTPLAKTSDSATLKFTDADPTSPQSVALTGTGS